MDIKDKRKQYYLDNHELKKKKALQYYYDNKEKALQYYYDNQEERTLYNREYWAMHGHKYILKRSEDIVYKANQRLYYQGYRERKKHIYTVNCIDKNLQDIKLQDSDNKIQDNITVIFKFSF